jgi:hypothetical protein
MADARQTLTDKMVLNPPYADNGQYRVRDADLPGFFVLVGKRRKSFMAQGEFWRDGIREFAVQVKLGELGEIWAAPSSAPNTSVEVRPTASSCSQLVLIRPQPPPSRPQSRSRSVA